MTSAVLQNLLGKTFAFFWTADYLQCCKTCIVSFRTSSTSGHCRHRAVLQSLPNRIQHRNTSGGHRIHTAVFQNMPNMIQHRNHKAVLQSLPHKTVRF